MLTITRLKAPITYLSKKAFRAVQIDSRQSIHLNIYLQLSLILLALHMAARRKGMVDRF
jgi:hypothetical protein